MTNFLETFASFFVRVPADMRQRGLTATREEAEWLARELSKVGAEYAVYDSAKSLEPLCVYRAGLLVEMNSLIEESR